MGEVVVERGAKVEAKEKKRCHSDVLISGRGGGNQQGGL